jgi:hypothetical protein
MPYYQTRVRPNACGGTSLIMSLGLSGMRFDYDASGKLRSVQSYDDFPFGDCNQNEYVYGTACELIGTEMPACGADDAGL